ncbi:hypothetical protein BED46_011370 [Burkholderia contaminans]|nr:hypothetical protein BED46_011370 [Burkholderia contaminans]
MFGGQCFQKAQHLAANATPHVGRTDEECVDLPVLDGKHTCADNPSFIDGNVEIAFDNARPFIGGHTIDPSRKSGIRIIPSACSMY